MQAQAPEPDRCDRSKSTSKQSKYLHWQPERVGMRTACGDCSRCAFLQRCHQKAAAATAMITTKAPAPMPASSVMPSPPELASASGAAVAVTVSGAASEVFAVETAPTEMPEDASARLRFVDVAAEAAAAASSFGTCGATRAVSRQPPPFGCAQCQRRGCTTLYRGARPHALFACAQ
jgi:hypothetical protein